MFTQRRIALLYPKKFEPGSTHNERGALLREMSDHTRSRMAAEVPFRFVRFDRPDARSRGWYVVDFGHGEIALEKSQVELVLLGFAAGLAVAQAASHATVTAWVGKLVQSFEEGSVPRPWTA